MWCPNHLKYVWASKRLWKVLGRKHDSWHHDTAHPNLHPILCAHGPLAAVQTGASPGLAPLTGLLWHPENGGNIRILSNSNCIHRLFLLALSVDPGWWERQCLAHGCTSTACPCRLIIEKLTNNTNHASGRLWCLFFVDCDGVKWYYVLHYTTVPRMLNWHWQHKTLYIFTTANGLIIYIYICYPPEMSTFLVC